MQKAIWTAAAFLAVSGSTAMASLQATGLLTRTATSPNNTYAITLNSTGTTTVGSFWYAWIPGQDYLATSPLTVSSPPNWSSFITGFPSSSNGYGIQWFANSPADYIPIGGSKSGFGFTSLDSYASVSGNSIFYPSTPVGTSFVYSQGLFSDAGYQFVVASAPIPEPTALALVTPALLLLRRRNG